MAHNRPDVILVEKTTPKWVIMDIAVPSDFNVVRTEDWKIEKYQDQVIGSLEVLGINDIIANTLMTSLLGTAGILRRAMDY